MPHLARSVEDRLRRTFAARAEDLAPGDADEASAGLVVPAPFPADHRSRWTRRPLHAAAVVVLVALVAGGIALATRDAWLAAVGVPAVVVPEPDMVGQLDRSCTEVQQGLDTLVADAAGTPFEEPVTTLVGEIELAGLLDVTGDAPEAGVDVSALLGSLDVGESFTAYLDRVEEILASQE